MQVRVLDIKEIVVEIPDRQITITMPVCPDSGDAMIDPDGLGGYSSPTIETADYPVHKLYDPVFKHTDHIAVRDCHLLGTLLKMAENRIKSIKSEHYTRGYHAGQAEGYQKGLEHGDNVRRDAIRGLPWWKRLLKKF